MTVTQIENLRNCVQSSMNMLIEELGPIRIGSKRQFPYGWRKSAKGRTVWRIVEEIITQNLEKYHNKFLIDEVIPSSSEVSVYDLECKFGNDDVYINIKSAVEGGKRQKDDISKANGLRQFYIENPIGNFFISTFYIRFNSNMTIEITDVIVFPVVWIPDIYINPSNNGNLQSAYYKDLSYAIKRTNDEFLSLFEQEYVNALNKKRR